MQEVWKSGRMEGARRCLQAAVEHMAKQDFTNAGALFRAAGRYMDDMSNGNGPTTGDVVPFPLSQWDDDWAQNVAEGW